MAAPLPQQEEFRRDFQRGKLAARRKRDGWNPPSANNNSFGKEGSEFLAPPGANNNFFFEEDGGSNNKPANNNRFFGRNPQNPYPNTLPYPPSLPVSETPDYEEDPEGPDPYAFNNNFPEEGTSEQQETSARRREATEMAAQAREKLNEVTKKEAERMLAKFFGNGANAVDSVGWDGWITFALSYIYLMARGVVTILAPESSGTEEGDSAAKKSLHTVLPPYRPLQEPGDFLYFLFVIIITTIIGCIIITVLIVVVNIFLFPLFMPGGMIGN